LQFKEPLFADEGGAVVVLLGRKCLLVLLLQAWMLDTGKT
jgi:hypothetical protein